MPIISINLQNKTIEEFDNAIKYVINKDNRPITRSKAMDIMIAHLLLSPDYIPLIIESNGYIISKQVVQ